MALVRLLTDTAQSPSALLASTLPSEAASVSHLSVPFLTTNDWTEEFAAFAWTQSKNQLQSTDLAAFVNPGWAHR